MSDRRYFYTDALAAAWMARHHGMNFRNESHEMLSLGVNHGEATWYLKYGLPQKYEDDVYMVHPDSVHLFDPRRGDLIRWHNPDAFDNLVHRIEVVDNDLPLHPDNRLLEIIQRNGTVFHWPQTE